MSARRERSARTTAAQGKSPCATAAPSQPEECAPVSTDNPGVRAAGAQGKPEACTTVTPAQAEHGAAAEVRTTQHSASPERLVDLLVQQRDLYRRLSGLSERQRTLVSQERPELLLNVLQERQTLVMQLAGINEQLTPFRQNWEAVYAALPENTRAEASRLLGEVNQILKQILQNDRVDGALLSARKQLIAQSLGELSGGRTANAAYAQPARGQGAARSEFTA